MAQIITINKEDELFPEAFKAIGEDCPGRIYAMGNLDLLKREHLVAIIGSRKATRTGNSKAYNLGISYAKKGYVVVSGLALGCDASAHRGCMAADGGTIAIVATGLNLVHPRENIPLQAEILHKGGAHPFRATSWCKGKPYPTCSKEQTASSTLRRDCCCRMSGAQRHHAYCSFCSEIQQEGQGCTFAL